MKDKQASHTSSVVYAHLGYARSLMQQGNYHEAIPLLKQGIAISQARTNAVHRNELYETLSICYEKLHQYREALGAYKHFRIENDSLFSEDKERDLNEMQHRYDTERQENLIKQSKLEMIQKEQRLQQLSFILTIIILVLGLLYYLYHRKNKLYLSIVKQNQDAIKRENELSRRISELENQGSNPTKYASSSLTDEKSMVLFRQLEHLMRNEKIYRDNELTKDKVSELLGTNRTYLSRIINEQTQMSFTYYVNRFRIEEAIRQLSDPANDIPLKALASELGFNSLSTFYNLFQSAVGMTPAQYRSKVKKIENLR
jgi:AraC-like DNA-binding protein